MRVILIHPSHAMDPKLSVKKNTSKTTKIQQVLSCQCMFQVFSPILKNHLSSKQIPKLFSTPLSALTHQPAGPPRWPSPQRGSRDLRRDVRELNHLVFVVSFEEEKTPQLFLHLIQGGCTPLPILSRWSEITPRSRVVLFTPGKTPTYLRLFPGYFTPCGPTTVVETHLVASPLLKLFKFFN